MNLFDQLEQQKQQLEQVLREMDRDDWRNNRLYQETAGARREIHQLLEWRNSTMDRFERRIYYRLSEIVYVRQPWITGWLRWRSYGRYRLLKSVLEALVQEKEKVS